ncbi:uncharacterized protein LOC117605351 [Osmia lignaria lignaria]|uniref:uncharacterized protein LOC117605351 n=1 Tax=Osmia lignaria lignaria TaxID=1437193 RepID=UPI0014783C61|nr:uncharacterized protein LOC117605351 [Osmia lignaria]
MYTDGSKRQGAQSVGAAVVTKNHDNWNERVVSVNPRATIFTAEAIAMVEALKTYKESEDDRRLLLYSDSASVLKVLDGIKSKSMSDIPNGKRNEIIAKILKELHEICVRKNLPCEVAADRKKAPVVFVWVPAHKGIVGNEKADEAAKRATDRPPDSDYVIPYEDILVTLVESAWKDFSTYMRREATYKGARYFNEIDTNEGCKKPWFKKFAIQTKRTISVLSKVRSNHYNLGELLARKYLVEDPGCDCGQAVEDLCHVMWECEKYDHIRGKFIDKLRERELRGRPQYQDLIKRDKPAVCVALARFLIETSKII